MSNPKSTVSIAGHPIHPMLIPFPIAFFVATFLCDLAYWQTSNSAWATAAIWLLGAGLIMAALAAIAGLTDVLGEPRIRALKDVWWHAGGNVLVVLIQLYNFAAAILRERRQSCLMAWSCRLSSFVFYCSPAGRVGKWCIATALALPILSRAERRLPRRHGVRHSHDLTGFDEAENRLTSVYANQISVPGVLFWFAPLQRIHTRSPSRKAGASAVLDRRCPLLALSGHGLVHRTCPLSTQSGHELVRCTYSLERLFGCRAFDCQSQLSD